MLKCGHLEKVDQGVVLKQEDWGIEVEGGLGKRTLTARGVRENSLCNDS